ncbi:hypothetical protein [Aquabacter spiritensis]|uniref:Uncharacterized protein n=1 Tax=Aquabacter spiritensis TaxID=933073 RepID=A0A4R3LNJ9_9HYPH|nr:hypothetical protein [Aquabacter spiritensis]TCT02033.1 hypothetical protein EDC64_11564 [Aquabacter spiritensis]
MINMLDLKPGDRLQLREGEFAQVVANMEDGMWVEVRTLETATAEPDPSEEPQLCHAQDIVRLLTPAG